MSPEVAGTIAIAKDVAMGLAAVVGATAAVIGLKAWRHQLRGHTEYELARRLLRAVYHARDELHAVRNPLILTGEFAAARQEAGIERDDKRTAFSAEEEGAVYERRWKRLSSAMSDLQLEVTEAEVVWGRAVVGQLKPLRECVGELYASLMLFLRRKQERPQGRSANPEALERIDRIIYKISDDPDQDPFTGKVARAVAQVEDFVRPYLRL